MGMQLLQRLAMPAHLPVRGDEIRPEHNREQNHDAFHRMQRNMRHKVLHPRLENIRHHQTRDAIQRGVQQTYPSVDIEFML